MNTYDKPLPVGDEHSRPFWDAARRHELRLPQCMQCGACRAQFEKWCHACGHDKFRWMLLSGRGKIWSHCEFHKAYFASFVKDLPYNVALVELAEGPRLVSNIVDIAYDDLHIGMEVEAVYDSVSPEVTLIRFRPTHEEQAALGN
jgi:uncharacterized OB-fold protein